MFHQKEEWWCSLSFFFVYYYYMKKCSPINQSCNGVPLMGGWAGGMIVVLYNVQYYT